MKSRLDRVSKMMPRGTVDDVRVPKTAEIVAARIRRRIGEGQLQQNEALPSERDLIQQFSISRPTLREALRILESEGLITVRRGRGGARVQLPTTDAAARYASLVLQHRGAKLSDLFAVRVMVEAPAAGIVAKRTDRKACAAALRQFLDELEGTEDTEAQAATYSSFNQLLVSQTENQPLIMVTTMLESISDAASIKYVRHVHESDQRLLKKSIRARRQLADLIQEGQAQAAESLWRAYLEESGSALASGLGEKLVDILD